MVDGMVVIDSRKLLMQGDERKEGSRVFLIGRGGRVERFFQKRGNLAPLFFAPPRSNPHNSNIFQFTLIIVTFNYSIPVPF